MAGTPRFACWSKGWVTCSELGLRVVDHEVIPELAFILRAHGYGSYEKPLACCHKLLKVQLRPFGTETTPVKVNHSNAQNDQNLPQSSQTSTSIPPLLRTLPITLAEDTPRGVITEVVAVPPRWTLMVSAGDWGYLLSRCSWMTSIIPEKR